MGWTAIDAHWWFGGNKRRGIGQYLVAYFSQHCHIPRSQRRWIVPYGSNQLAAKELQDTFGGEVIVLPQEGVTANWIHQQKEQGCSQIFFASPFERPHSLLDFWPVFSEAKIRGEAIIFDLLPLQFPEEILSKWSSSDQLAYRVRLEYLRNIDFLWSISPATYKAAHLLLKKEQQKMKVLAFGMKTTWIQITAPIENEKILRDVNRVVTISGGEWRKNIEGTIDFFLRNFAPPSKLVVICKLGKKQLWRWKWQLLLRGAVHRVVFAGEVTEEDKWRYLLSAQSFLFLSRAEGLGIPLLEAQKAQVPNIYVSSELIREGLGVLVDSPIPVNI